MAFQMQRMLHIHDGYILRPLRIPKFANIVMEYYSLPQIQLRIAKQFKRRVKAVGEAAEC